MALGAGEDAVEHDLRVTDRGVPRGGPAPHQARDAGVAVVRAAPLAERRWSIQATTFGSVPRTPARNRAAPSPKPASWTDAVENWLPTRPSRRARASAARSVGLAPSSQASSMDTASPRPEEGGVRGLDRGHHERPVEVLVMRSQEGSEMSRQP